MIHSVSVTSVSYALLSVLQPPAETIPSLLTEFSDVLLYLGRGNIPDQNELSGQSGSASQYALLVVRGRALDLADPGAFLQTAPYPRLRACI